jgi:N-acetyl-gamma-glutamyl-phosphate reductase
MAGRLGVWPCPIAPCAKPVCINNRSAAYFFEIGKDGCARRWRLGGNMGVRVAVAGASGYAGGELLRLIAAHPDLELGPVTAGASAGLPVTDVHPHLPALADRIFGRADPEVLAGADLVFLALPPEESAAMAGSLPTGAAIVDLSASFRLADPQAWATYYGTGHAGRWTYGLPELPGARDGIRAARRVASPGCYATAAILALAPLVAAGLVEAQDCVIVAASGASGAGRSPSAALLGTEVMGAVSAYKAGGEHRHIPEIEQALREVAGGQPAICFTPTLAPMPRGILATCTARLASPQTGTQALRDALAGAYGGEPFVHVLPEGRWPTTAATVGSNAVHLQAAADAHAGRAVVIAALDNLVKGAAGQAVQAANLMLGLPETAGLSAHGVAP